MQTLLASSPDGYDHLPLAVPAAGIEVLDLDPADSSLSSTLNLGTEPEPPAAEPGHNPNRDRPLRNGYGIVPHRLWTLDGLNAKQRCLLGWLHSHADDYLDRLSLRRIGREFGGNRRTETDVKALAARGLVRIDQASAGLPARVVLLSDPWEQLLSSPPPVPSDDADAGHNPNRDRPLRNGYGIVPHRLWTLDGLNAKQRCLLGWLHSHADDYLDRLSLRRIGREFGGNRRDVIALADAGYLRIDQASAGLPARVVLLSDPWEQLSTTATRARPPQPEPVIHNRDQSEATTATRARPQRSINLEDHQLTVSESVTRVEIEREVRRIKESTPAHWSTDPDERRMTYVLGLSPSPPARIAACFVLGEGQSLVRWQAAQEPPAEPEPDEPGLSPQEAMDRGMVRI